MVSRSKFLLPLVLSFCFSALAWGQMLPLVPPPTSVDRQDGPRFPLPEVMTVSVPGEPGWAEHLEVLSDRMVLLTRGQHRLENKQGVRIRLLVQKDASLAGEAYLLRITPDQIQLTASSLKGLARSTATLLQLLGEWENGSLPCLAVTDSPALSYRNLMIDMGRNPHSLSLLKETIDLLWYYKIDSLQLHLTDDQRFAFPSTKFPRLWDGEITVEEFKELEAYAIARGVTLIPELEVPGHSGILRSQYPDVFGKSATDLAGQKSALDGIKILLDEMMEVFSSTPYVHIGGDEAFGVSEELQRDLINKLHAYLKSKGKQTVVWEGPRPGTGANKVHEEVIHLNWRTINYPADQMLKDGYRVVNATWDPLYLVDHYPRINFTMTTPQHIYEQLQLRTFKHVNPGISTYAKPIQVEPSDRLIGFCMPWWEGREVHFVSHVFPRAIPFADVSWNLPGSRDFAEFEKRVKQTEKTRTQAFYPIQLETSQLAVDADRVFHKQVQVTLRSNHPGTIRYTLDQTEPGPTSPVYKAPMTLSETGTLRAALFREGRQVGNGLRENFVRVEPLENLALGKPLTSSLTSASPFSLERLTDGGTENLEFYLGYPTQPSPLVVTIDLEQPEEISKVVVFAYTINNSFEKYAVEVSENGEDFHRVGTRLERPEQPERFVEHTFEPRRVRYVRIVSEGNKGYVFDSFSKLVEIQVFH